MEAINTFLDTAPLGVAIEQVEQGVISYMEVKQYFSLNNAR